jgi:hypothetical protein
LESVASFSFKGEETKSDDLVALRKGSVVILRVDGTEATNADTDMNFIDDEMATKTTKSIIIRVVVLGMRAFEISFTVMFVVQHNYNESPERMTVMVWWWMLEWNKSNKSVSMPKEHEGTRQTRGCHAVLKDL